MYLALFFSRGVSLKLWVDKGLFTKEKLLYEEHLNQNNLKKIYWLTYGSEDKELARQLKRKNELHKDIEILQMPKIFNIPKIGSYIYSLFLPFYYKKQLQMSSILKTNQTDGSWSAVIAKKLYNKKLLYRTGFVMSQLENHLKRFNSFTRIIIEWVEKIAYKNCDRAIVSSKHSLKYIIDKYHVNISQIDIIYNYVNRKNFFDFKQIRENKVIFVGRLSEEKNLFNLIKALNKIGLSLEIYGSGYMKKELELFIANNSYNVKLMGNVDNSNLSYILNTSKYFALVSKHEGMPKALIEALSCGCICVGTDVAGINEVIINNYNGILAKNTSSKEILKSFQKAIQLSDVEIGILKSNAQRFVDNYFNLHNIVKQEQNVFEKLL